MPGGKSLLSEIGQNITPNARIQRRQCAAPSGAVFADVLDGQQARGHVLPLVEVVQLVQSPVNVQRAPSSDVGGDAPRRRPHNARGDVRGGAAASRCGARAAVPATPAGQVANVRHFGRRVVDGRLSSSGCVDSAYPQVLRFQLLKRAACAPMPIGTSSKKVDVRLGGMVVAATMFCFVWSRFQHDIREDW